MSSLTVQYNGSTIQTVEEDKTIALKCAGKLMADDVTLVADGLSSLTVNYGGSAILSETDATGTWKLKTSGKIMSGDVQLAVVAAPPVTIYGVSWDGTSTTVLSRTDASASFTDPVPALNGTGGSSPFDNLMPWSGMVKEERTGGTMVKIPKFWYKLTQVGTQGVKIQIADGEVDGFSVSPAHMDRGDGKGERDYVYIGRYHCATSTYKSTTGVKPMASQTRATFRTQCKNIGTGYSLADFHMRFTIWLLYIVEFANWNSQAVIGYGCGCGDSGATENMGYTDGMSYHTGTTKSSRTTYGVSTQYRWIEGLWDNVFDWLGGCYNSSAGLNIINNPANDSDSANGTSVGTPVRGWIAGLKVTNSGPFPMFINSNTSGGGGSAYVADDWVFYTSTTCLFAGGSYNQSQNYGMFFLNFSGASNKYTVIGGRLQELPPKAA